MKDEDWMKSMIPKVFALFAVSLFAACTGPAETPAPAASGAKSPASAPAPAPAPAATGGSSTVYFELEDAVSIGALQLDVEYSSAGGAFAGDGDKVECKSTVEGALSSFNHLGGAHILKAAFVAVQGFTGPVRFAECRYEGTPNLDGFRVSVQDVSTPDLADLPSDPVIKVTLQ